MFTGRMRGFLSLCFFGFCQLSVGALSDFSMERKLDVETEDLLRIDKILRKKQRSFSDVEALAGYKEKYSNNAFSKPSFQMGYFGLRPQKINLEAVDLDAPIIDAINKKWDIQEFERVHSPVQIGEVLDREVFSQLGVLRAMHLPVKFPKSEFRIPNEYQHLTEMLQKVIDFEAAINPDWDEYYAYLTVDQRFVPGGQAQRIVGPHVDGLPKNRNHPNSNEIDHAYVVSDSVPTKFYAHSFPEMKRYDLLKHDFWSIFDHFKNESLTLYTRPFEITLMNAYSVHTAVESNQDLIRTFVRLEFSKSRFDRKGNSTNPYFQYEWEWRDCSFPSNLILPAELAKIKIRSRL